ncbi:ATP-binding protein [Aeromonas eucrenophila]|uniref:histidine kinase n=1 Tax=Aeromonas eucrenophila TaxID=649 RepID=A0ABW0YFQ5_9GAMM|nr:transporter substrate-binding domain-containing protein [Aeromonas eucrenophila]
MLCRCYRLVLLCWLACWSLVTVAATALSHDNLVQAEQLWLESRSELVVGMVSVDWPPYVYTNGQGGFSGPLDDFAERVSNQLGLTLKYKGYPDYARAQQALIDGEADLLLGVVPEQRSQQQALKTLDIMGVPRGILLARSQTHSSLAEARAWRWVCIRGFGACDELGKLGMTSLEEADSVDEAAFMVKRGLVDAYLADLPTLLRLQQLRQHAKLQVITPPWVPATRLTMVMTADNLGLHSLLQRVLDSIPDGERSHLLEADGGIDYGQVQGLRQSLFNQDELNWLAQHSTLKYGVSPNWPAMSNISKRGELTGFVADLLELMSARSGLKFTLVPTQSWADTLGQFQASKLDFVPAVTPTDERRRSMLFTPDYAFINRVIVAKQGVAELPNTAVLKGRRVGMVRGSVEQLLLEQVGAVLVVVDSDTQLLSLLDSGEAEYTLMSMNTLGQALQKGFSERYRVVFSGNELRVPIAMAVQRKDPMLQQILSKALLSVRPDELARLEHKWMSLTIQTGIDPGKVLFWSSLGGGIFLLCVLLFVGWNRTLRRQISQRREAERRLEEQLAFVQMLLDALPNQVVLTNERYEIAMTNRAYRQLFLQGENLSGSYELLLQDRLPDAIRARVIEEDARVWESGEELNGSGEVQLSDGALHQMLYTKRLFVGPDNKRLGILTVLTDVTELQQARSAALEAETRLTQITDSMPGLVYQYHWIGPRNGRFLYTSQGIKEMVDYDEDPVQTAVSGHTLLGLTGAASDDFIETVGQHARTMKPLDLEVEVRRNGELCYLQIRGHFTHQKGLEGVILNGVVQDITGLKRQALELRQARTVAEEAMQARSRFLATMSHELRTPISGMHGMLELLQMSDLDDDQRYMLRNVSTSTNHLLYLVNDILDFSKMEAGQLQLHYQVGRLTTVICDVIRGHATLAHGKGLGVTLAWGAEVPDQASIDAIRVGQVISNLLNNAVKFTESGQIDIRVDYDDHRLAFIVQDSGIGIPLDKQANLFTPFKQVESDITRRFGGTGLGLAICHQLAQKMGGSLTLESQPGVGTRMTFRVPLSDCQWDLPPLAGQDWWWFGEDAVLQSVMERFGARLHRLEPAQWQPSLGGCLLAQESHLEQALGGDWLQHLQQSALKGIVLSSQEALRGRMGSDAWWRLGQSPLYPDLLLETCRQLSGERAVQPVQALGDKLQGRVLVADDHPVNRALLARQLAILGIDAELVDDGEKALRAWQGQGFALLLTDCHMPVMDGYTLTRTLRAAGDEAPIIGVTADASEEASLQMQAAGMNDMLFKPYSLETLRQTLERWLPTASLPPCEPEPLVQARAQEQGLSWLSLFGDEALARSMAMEYLDSNRQDSEDMMRALARQDAQALVETAHRIKGAARMVGQLALAEEAARLETAARLKQLDRLTELSQTVQALMDSITGEIGLWLDE